MTYGGRWEQLKSGAATHLPFRAGHNRMHTAKAGLGMENGGFPCLFYEVFVIFEITAKKILATGDKIGYNTQVYAQT